MFNKKKLVIFSSLIIVLLITLLLVPVKDKNVFTKMVKIASNFNSANVEELEVVEVNTEEMEVANDVDKEEKVEEIQEEEVIEEVVPEVVYEGMTMDELAAKIDRSLKNELSGKGYLYASYSLEKGVDPYLAVAISLEETGCNWNCSNLVRSCNNVGGMKGSGCGSYGYFNTLDDGIRAFIDNIKRNYVDYGLTTAETMNSKYAENPAWSTNVNNYINRIRNK